MPPAPKPLSPTPMKEDDWNPTEEAPPPKKSRIPRWALFGCGGCSVVLLVVGVAVAIFAMRWWSKASDPEVQWPRLAQVLPFDERPQGLELHMGTSIVVGNQFVLTNEDESLLIEIVDYDLDPQDFDEILTTQAPGHPRDPVEGELEIQGRSVPTYTFQQKRGEALWGGKNLGPGIRFDLRAGDRLATVDIRRLGSQEPLKEEEARAFFDHFDVWRGR